MMSAEWANIVITGVFTAIPWLVIVTAIIVRLVVKMNSVEKSHTECMNRRTAVEDNLATVMAELKNTVVGMATDIKWMRRNINGRKGADDDKD